MQPVIIIPPKTISKSDIRLLRKNNICVVEASDPSAVRFIDPPPSLDYSAQERTAIKLYRVLMDRSQADTCRNRRDIGYLYAKLLIEGTTLDARAIPPPKKAKQ